MSAAIINVCRGRRNSTSGCEQTVLKRVTHTGSSKPDGQRGKSVSQNVKMGTDQQGGVGGAAPPGKKRKGKLPDGRAKEPSSPLRRTRSRTVVGTISKDDSNMDSPVEAKSGKHIGLGNRKRSRETLAVALGAPTSKKSPVRIRTTYLPHLAKISEEKSVSEEENANSEVFRVTPRRIGIVLRRNVRAQRKVVTKGPQKAATGAGAERRKTAKKPTAKKSSTVVVNVARAKTTPQSGLQELRRSTRQSGHNERNPPVRRKSESADTNDSMAALAALGLNGIADDNVRVTRSKSTTNALRVADDATGFVRTALNAVAEARIREQQSKKLVGEEAAVPVAAEAVSKDENRSNSNGSTRSNRSRSSITAEKLIQELDSFRLASKGQGTDMKEKLRKGITRLTRATSRLAKQQEGSTASLKKASTPTKLPRVANKENLPKATESALVRRVKGDIEDHAKRYGLLEQVRPPLPGRSARNSGPRTPAAAGLEQQGSGLEDCPQSTNDWTSEQEIALQNAYVSVKPAADFWYHISKRVPGRTAEECFNKFYAGHPTPPAAQRSKRQTGNAAEDAADDDALCKPKGKAAGGKQRLLEAHRTIRNILRKQQVDDEEYEADAFVALERPDVVESLNPEEAEGAAMLKVTGVPTCTPAPVVSETKSSNKRFDNSVTGGLPSDKENRNMNALGSGKGRILVGSPAQLCSPEVLKKLKDPTHLDKYIDHLHQRHSRRPRTGGQTVIKKNNVYLHSKDALDFGDDPIDAIQRAKEELRNVILKSGANRNFLDVVGSGQEEEGEDEDEDEYDGEVSYDCDG
ncbi:hypothetical protein Mapa_014110 [Marchantia paleacea]|nr:hypothetical protein Mapa_014110 [Marchantia paleacea]